MTQGLEEMRGIAQECGGDLALLVNHSGGENSNTNAGIRSQEVSGSPIYAVMADTGFEHAFPITAAIMNKRGAQSLVSS